MGLVTNKEKRKKTDVEWLGQLRDLLVSRVKELLVAQEARTLVQERYLDGHGALFPDLARAWDEQVNSTGIIADMAGRLAEIDGVEPADQDDPEAITVRASQLVADLVEPAKSTALEKLGEGRPAFDIANAWLRQKFSVAAVPEP